MIHIITYFWLVMGFDTTDEINLNRGLDKSFVRYRDFFRQRNLKIWGFFKLKKIRIVKHRMKELLRNNLLKKKILRIIKNVLHKLILQ